MRPSLSVDARFCGTCSALQAGTSARFVSASAHGRLEKNQIARRHSFSHRTSPVITDPFFYLLALPAITVLGLGKGGFAGIGMAAAPLLSLYIPPLQAAAILLPILLCQDAISVWTYRRDWDAWNVKVMTVGALIGLGAAWLFAAFVSDAAVRLIVGLIGGSFVLNAWFRRPKLVAPTVPRGIF